MKTRILSKLSIFLITAVITAGSSYGYSDAEQSIQTTVQPAVAIESLSSSIVNGTVTNVMTGEHSGLRSEFSLKTNGSDSDYDFIIYSRIKSSDDSEVSAYGKDGQLLFAHTLAYPTLEAINNAKEGGNNNKNVIAYPVTATGADMSVSYQKNHSQYGDCYVVKINSVQDGTVFHSVEGSPVSGSYNVTQDQAGTYQAVVYFTAVSK